MGLLSGISAPPTRGHSVGSPTAWPWGMRAAEVGAVLRHRRAPASPSSGRSAALPGQPPLPGLAALLVPIFIPGKVVLPPCRPTCHVASGCLRSSLISPWRSRCGVGSWTCRLAALFRQPRTDGAAAGDRRTSLGGLWRRGPAPVGARRPPACPSIRVPATPAAPHSIPTCPILLPAAAWPRGNLQVPGPAPSIPAPGGRAPPGHRGPAATCCQCGPSPGWAGSSGAEVSLFLAACSGIWWWGGLCPRLPSLAGSRSPGPGALLRPSWADCTG